MPEASIIDYLPPTVFEIDIIDQIKNGIYKSILQAYGSRNCNFQDLKILSFYAGENE